MASGKVLRSRLYRWLGALTAVGLIGMGGVAGLRVLHPPNPVVNGAPMNEWVRKLTERWTSEHRAYAYPPGVRSALSSDREAAIRHLIAAVKDRPGAFDAVRGKAGKGLPEFLARIVIPRRPRCRWAGLMALSDLAYKQPDVRIDRLFEECINDPDPVVRKIAAYEMGPWIFPNHPAVAANLLRKALQDPVSDVRRDACRRITMTDATRYPAYTSHMRALLDDIEKLARKDSSRYVRESAERAYEALAGGELALARQKSSLRP